MSKNFDLIATVDIDLSTPLFDETSFGNICIVGPLPKKAPTTAPAKVGVYSSLKEVTDAGWDATSETPDPVGKAAMVAFSQSPRPTQIYIAPVQASEDPVEAVKRACDETNGWYVLCTAGVDEEKYESIAAYIETQTRMFVYTEMNCITNASGTVKVTAKTADTYFRTAGIYGREFVSQTDDDVPPANAYMNVAWAVKWLYHESGTETAAFKSLAAVSPCRLSTNELNLLVTNDLNYFIEMGNKKISMNGKVRGGEWCDIIRFRDWLKNDMQLRVVNLFVTTPKIPYTDAGIALVQNQMIASLMEGQAVGGIAPDEFDEDGNRIPGFATSVPLAASISASEKATRKLTKCKFKARLAGAIHFADLDGTLAYEI